MTVLLSIGGPFLGFALGWVTRWLYARYQLLSVEQRSERLRRNAADEAKREGQVLLLRSRDQILQERREFEREQKEQSRELQGYEKRIRQREDNLEERLLVCDQQLVGLAEREGAIKEKETLLVDQEVRCRQTLEEVAHLTQKEAEALLLESLKGKVREDALGLIQKVEREAELEAERRAREVVVSTMQRLAAEVTSEVTVTTEELPSDEMKGRIIGREGRNVRLLETLTGVDLIIDDTPDSVVLSCFDPIRLEIAKRSLRLLVLDRRIHPVRIEEVVHKVASEVGQAIYQEGEKALFDLGFLDMKDEVVQAVGRLHFRSSYGQNQLAHTKEVAKLAAMLAAEVGANRDIAKRGGLFHDIGKGLETVGDASHVELSADFCRRIGEDPRVINAVESHHGDVKPTCVESILVQTADAISASRPGARREVLANYIKRLKDLERIAKDFPGVSNVYAVQAGREVRIMVDNEVVSDKEAALLAREIADCIESQMRYPGRIRVTMIRETRIVEYAR